VGLRSVPRLGDRQNGLAPRACSLGHACPIFLSNDAGDQNLPAIPSKTYAFVKLGPLLNPDSPQAFWDFLVVLRGADPLYHVSITFQDMDAVAAFQKNPSDVGLIQRSMKTYQFPELDPTGDPKLPDREVQQIYWAPTALRDGHYSVVIDDRTGSVAENLYVKEVDGKWSVAMNVRDRVTTRSS